MIQVLGDGLEWFERVPQHCQVNFHLPPILPAFEESRLLIKGSKHHVGNIAHATEDLLAALPVKKINGHEVSARNRRRQSSRYSRDFPAFKLCETAHGAEADQT